MLLAQNKTVGFDTDKKLYRPYRIMIKSVAILFEVEVITSIYTVNKSCAKYFINFKMFCNTY